MEWILDFPLWPLIIFVVLLFLACIIFFMLYIKELRQKRALMELIAIMQNQVIESHKIAEKAFNVARKQNENAIFVLHRVLTAREREEEGVEPE